MSMITINFYRSANGNEPVREWLKELNRADRKVIGDDLQTVQLGWQKGIIKEPLVKSFGNGLFEVRTTLTTHRIARILFCIEGNIIVLLHGFIKKTKKTPVPDLALAKKRHKLVSK